MSHLGLTRLCRTREDGPLPGDRCPIAGCVGEIIVYDSRLRSGFRFRYLQCNTCKHKPHNNKMIDAEIPIDSTNTAKR